MTERKLGGNRGNAGKGRPKGSQNKTTAAVKEGLLFAYEGMGGAEALLTWGRENQTEFFKLLAKLLPQEIKSDVNLSFNHEEALADLD